MKILFSCICDNNILEWRAKKNVRPEEQDRRIKTKRKTNFKQVSLYI